MPVFLERMILPVLAAILVIVAVTNPLQLGWQVRVFGSLALLAISYLVARMVHSGYPKLTSPAPVPAVVPTMVEAERQFVHIGADDLMAMCRGHTRIQIEQLTNPYIGKWMKVEGSLDDVSDTKPYRDGERLSGVSISLITSSGNLIRLQTVREASVTLARTLRRLDIIDVECRIERCYGTMMESDDAVILQAKAPTNTD